MRKIKFKFKIRRKFNEGSEDSDYKKVVNFNFMALIKCVECGHNISDAAFTCPNCGRSLRNINKTTQQTPVVIEKTKKKWKIVKLISVIIFIVGLYIFLIYFQKGGFNNPMTGLGFCVAFVGFSGILIGKFGAWWTNK